MKSIAHVILSTRSGMGKTLRVKRMAEIIKRINNSMLAHISIPIHGPEISIRYILEQLKPCMQDPTDPHPQIIHFNVAQSVSALYIIIIIL